MTTDDDGDKKKTRAHTSVRTKEQNENEEKWKIQKYQRHGKYKKILYVVCGNSAVKCSSSSSDSDSVEQRCCAFMYFQHVYLLARFVAPFVALTHTHTHKPTLTPAHTHTRCSLFAGILVLILLFGFGWQPGNAPVLSTERCTHAHLTVFAKRLKKTWLKIDACFATFISFFHLFLQPEADNTAPTKHARRTNTHAMLIYCLHSCIRHTYVDACAYANAQFFTTMLKTFRFLNSFCFIFINSTRAGLAIANNCAARTSACAIDSSQTYRYTGPCMHDNSIMQR